MRWEQKRSWRFSVQHRLSSSRCCGRQRVYRRRRLPSSPAVVACRRHLPCACVVACRRRLSASPASTLTQIQTTLHPRRFTEVTEYCCSASTTAELAAWRHLPIALTTLICAPGLVTSFRKSGVVSSGDVKMSTIAGTIIVFMCLGGYQVRLGRRRKGGVGGVECVKDGEEPCNGKLPVALPMTHAPRVPVPNPYTCARLTAQPSPPSGT